MSESKKAYRVSVVGRTPVTVASIVSPDTGRSLSIRRQPEPFSEAELDELKAEIEAGRFPIAVENLNVEVIGDLSAEVALGAVKKQTSKKRASKKQASKKQAAE